MRKLMLPSLTITAMFSPRSGSAAAGLRACSDSGGAGTSAAIHVHDLAQRVADEGRDQRTHQHDA
ncbi:hypothetical protein YO5_08073 [Stutzerimonas stutzeri TS44]|nr:hypothetical protein YO5_08073 [Stutzerimonas stutzeri TS44]